MVPPTLLLWGGAVLRGSHVCFPCPLCCDLFTVSFGFTKQSLEFLSSYAIFSMCPLVASTCYASLFLLLCTNVWSLMGHREPTGFYIGFSARGSPFSMHTRFTMYVYYCLHELCRVCSCCVSPWTSWCALSFHFLTCGPQCHRIWISTGASAWNILCQKAALWNLLCSYYFHRGLC